MNTVAIFPGYISGSKLASLNIEDFLARVLAVAAEQVLRPPAAETELLFRGILDHQDVSLDLFPAGRSRWMRRQWCFVRMSLRPEASRQRGYPAALRAVIV